MTWTTYCFNMLALHGCQTKLLYIKSNIYMTRPLHLSGIFIPPRRVLGVQGLKHLFLFEVSISTPFKYLSLAPKPVLSAVNISIYLQFHFLLHFVPIIASNSLHYFELQTKYVTQNWLPRTYNSAQFCYYLHHVNNWKFCIKFLCFHLITLTSQRKSKRFVAVNGLFIQRVGWKQQVWKFNCTFTFLRGASSQKKNDEERTREHAKLLH